MNNCYTIWVNQDGEDRQKSFSVAEKLADIACDVNENSSCNDINKLKNTMLFFALSQPRLIKNERIASSIALLNGLQKGVWAAILAIQMIVVVPISIQKIRADGLSVVLAFLAACTIACAYYFFTNKLFKPEEIGKSETEEKRRLRQEENNKEFFEKSYLANARTELHYVLDVYENGYCDMGEKFNKETFYILIAYFLISVLIPVLFSALL